VKQILQTNETKYLYIQIKLYEMSKQIIEEKVYRAKTQKVDNKYVKKMNHEAPILTKWERKYKMIKVQKGYYKK
jgi:hypothetical protein